MRSLIIIACLATSVLAQDSGLSLVTAARKKIATARGLTGVERDVIFEEGLALLLTVPEKFPKQTPAVARAWLEAGRIQRRLSRLEEALKSFGRVLESEAETRRCCDALHDIASIRRSRKERALAVEALARIVEDFPSEPRSRAQALIRIGGLKRELKDLDGAEAAYRRCLKEHEALWRPSVDALDRLVGLYLVRAAGTEARRLLDAESAAIRDRFAAGPHAQKVEKALASMRSRRRLDAIQKRGAPDRGGGDAR